MAQKDDRYGDNIEPIAIVGMACRFSGEASSVEGFWDMLSHARTGHRRVPPDRFNADSWHHPEHDRRGAIHTKHGFFSEENASLFDAPFFSITAKEAAGMDPMQRKLLEVAYESFENAGLPMPQLTGSMTSVYTGVMTNDYEMLSANDPYNLPQNAASGTSRAMLSNRVSWFFDLRGPSLTLDTACSSSLYAFHLACQSLRLGESKQALVTGVNMILHPNFISQLSAMHMLSPDGISHSFDSRANGYGRGEGIAGLILKPLSAAIADGNTIRAIVRGTGANQDGKTPGITMPSGEAQAALIRSTYAAAGLSLNDTTYFEAHGTGTSLGDPIELGAIGASFGAGRSAEAPPLYVGSVKTNVGHTEGTAGLAGVIKAVLAIEKGIIPANAGFENLNPKIRLEEWRLALPTETMAWPTSGLRRASVNSFGFGGSNAHIILDDSCHYLESHGLSGNHATYYDEGSDHDSGVSMGSASSTPDSEAGSNHRSKLFVFSAHDQNGIPRISSSYSEFLRNASKRGLPNPTYLDDLAHTLISRRTHFDFRSFSVSSSIKALAGQVETLPKIKRILRHDNVILVFTGQGAQWPAMGRELLRNAVFKKSMLDSQSFLESFGCAWSGIDILSDPDSKRIDIPEYCQPICTMLQIALVDLLVYWGIKPKATVGHSSGEIGAAYAAGGISHESAMKIAYFRGVYVDEIQRRLKDKKGTMLAAGITEPEAQSYLEKITDGVAVIGCVNSPTSVTISGDDHVLTHLEGTIQKDGKFARKLRVSVAYHSPHMQVVADDFLESMGAVDTLTQFSIPMVSSVTEKLVEDPRELNAAYWVRNMVSSVRFSGAVTTLLSYSSISQRRRKKPADWSAIVEVGPHETLKGPLSQIMSAFDKKINANVTYTSLLKRKQNAESTVLGAAGLLWCLGHSVDISKANGDGQNPNLRTLVDLPPYPWQHNKGFWHEPLASSAARLREQPRTDLLGVSVDNQNALEPRWRNHLRLPENPWLEDHTITGTILYPAAGMLIMVFEAALQIADTTKNLMGVEFQDVAFERGLVIPSADQAVETSLSIRPHERFDSSYHWTVFSMPPGGSWMKHSFGTFSIVYEQPPSDVDLTPESVAEWKAHTKSFEEIKSRATRPITPSGFYDQLESIGMGYGPLFRNVTSASAVPGRHAGHGTILVPDTKSSMPQEFEFPHRIHPATLDAIFHLLFVALFEGESMDEASIPVTMERMFIAADLPSGAGSKFCGFSKAVKTGFREASGDLVLSDEAWAEAKIIVRNMTVREVSSGSADIAQASSTADECPKRIAQLQWKEDVDHLKGPSAERLLRKEAWRYQSTDFSEAGAQLGVWLDRACHKDADLKVLIVNAEDNPELLNLLGQFAPTAARGLRFRECYVLEDSQSAYDTVDGVLNQQTLNVDLRILDLHEASQDQLSELGAFDVIISGTREISADQLRLKAMKSLLRPEGKLALLSRKVIKTSNESALQLGLKGAGLDELTIFVENELVDLAIASVSTKVEAETAPTEIYLLLPSNPSTELTSLKEGLSKRLNALDFTVKTTILSDAFDLKGASVISLLEVETPFILSWNEEQLNHFRQLITSARYLLWVTRGGFLDADIHSLEFAPTTGLLRTVRVEVPQITLPHLDLSPSNKLVSDSNVELFTTVLMSSMKIDSSSKNIETEMAETSGNIFIPRAVTDENLDLELELHSDKKRAVQGSLYQGDRALKLEMGITGAAESLRWAVDEEAVEPLTEEDIEIRTTHVSLNMSDLDTIAGNGLGNALGREAVGIVSKVGSNVVKVKPGDRVVASKPQAFRTHLRQRQKLVQRVPDAVRSEVAVALPTPFTTAYHALKNVARLSKGESVLIQSTDGGFDQAAIQIARHVGADVFALVGSKSKKILLMERYGLAEDHIVDSRTSSFASTALRATEGKGFDVIVSSCSGAAFQQLSSCLTEFGRFLDIGQKSNAKELRTAPLQGNTMFASIEMDRLTEETHANLLSNVFEMLDQCLIGEIFPTTRYSISELPKALNLFKSGDHHGKIVMTLEETAVVPLVPEAPPSPELVPEATYVLSGGLGALGLTIAENMYQHGARHMVFLSRSGASTSMQQEVVQSFRDRGCKIDTPKCDVTDALQVKSFVETCKQNVWNVKGVVQCAMVLRDSIFENMTMDKWLGATQPKIKGTWNLHSYMPHDLDFFVILSSMSGIIGNTAQANYCAGNTYEDALAHYRHKQGLAATTLNVGLVTDASHFNESSTIEDYLKRYSHWMPARVTDHEMQVTLAAAMRGKTASGTAVPIQLLVGIIDDIERDGLNLWPNDRKFDHRARPSSTLGSNSSKDQLERAKTVEDASAAVSDALRTNVATAITAAPEDIDVEKPLYSFGIDSLKAIEVRNWIFRELKADVSVFDLLSPTPMAKLAAKIVGRSALVNPDVAKLADVTGDD